jgi:hypothetical protein
MAVDYTKVFTVLGKYVDKLIDYYAYIATHNTDRDAIEATLSAQSVIHLNEGLVDVYEGFKTDVSGWEEELITLMTQVLTDQELIGSQFALGAQASLEQVFPVLLRDMFTTDKNVVASVAAVGAITDVYRANSLSGKVVIGTKLDGVTPPMVDAISIPQYAGLTTQLTPTAETMTFTCIDDSEHGTVRGSERFQITGTDAVSGPYSPTEENIGDLGTITVADNDAVNWGSNLSFDSWSGTPESPVSWEVTVGVAGTAFEKGNSISETLYGEGNSLKAAGAAEDFSIVQVLNEESFTRLKTYWLSFWCRKVTDASTDPEFTVTMYHGVGTLLQVTGIPTGVTWTNFSGQFLIPDEIVDDLAIEVAT